MTTYRYDGSFEGFLCAVAVALEKETADDAVFISADDAGEQPGLFGGGFCEIPAHRETAREIRDRFVRRAGSEAFAAARYAFYSRVPGSEQLVCSYVQAGIRQGRAFLDRLATEPVLSVNRLARKVSHEAHKFKGFVRFREVEGGWLYAAVEPEHDILLLIVRHFADRTGDRPWLIHDLKRSQAVAHDAGRLQLIRDIRCEESPVASAGEEEYAALWRSCFRSHAIRERSNAPLQQKHVPLRYRRQLTEFDQ